MTEGRAKKTTISLRAASITSSAKNPWLNRSVLPLMPPSWISGRWIRV